MLSERFGRRFSKSPDSDEYKWTCGASTDVVYKRPLATGGFGEVHEVMRDDQFDK